MRLTDIAAVADPGGNRIDLSWNYPATMPPTTGVRVVRGLTEHPQTPDDGVNVDEGVGLRAATDRDLHGETVYYYTLFPFTGTPARFEPDPQNRISAMATAPYGFADQLYNLLPALYRRYDADRGQLRRFLDLPGSQFDQLYSLARAATHLSDLDRVEGSLLPLLAQWIGWRTDFGLSVDRQRTEIRHAPPLYRTIGVIPALDATVTRVTGWPSRTKEFVHAVARTNQPERLNLWSMSRDGAGTWATAELASVNDAYEGRAAVVRLQDNSLLLTYHTFRRHGWDIWGKRFANGEWEPSEPIVDRPGVDKHPTVALQGNRVWLFWESHGDDGGWHVAWRTRTGGEWSAVEIFGDAATERRLPACAVDAAGGLWLFWLERLGDAWRVRYNRHDGTDWQLSQPATLPPVGGEEPLAHEDLMLTFHPSSTAGRLFLFWAYNGLGGLAGQTRWTVAYRVKQGLDPNASDWSPIRGLPPGDGFFHDREPFPLPLAGNGIELFWSSTRGGGWTVFASTLDTGTLTWTPVEQVVRGPFSGRAPVAVSSGPDTLLVYRSNASIASAVTRTVDERYAGTTTVDTANTAKLALFGTVDDFQTYITDAGRNGVRTDADRIGRDTVGLYTGPAAPEPDQMRASVSRLRGVLAEFMPITTRAVIVAPTAGVPQ